MKRPSSQSESGTIGEGEKQAAMYRRGMALVNILVNISHIQDGGWNNNGVRLLGICSVLKVK